jgi:hypothetical protein
MLRSGHGLSVLTVQSADNEMVDVQVYVYVKHINNKFHYTSLAFATNMIQNFVSSSMQPKKMSSTETYHPLNQQLVGKILNVIWQIFLLNITQLLTFIAQKLGI